MSMFAFFSTSTGLISSTINKPPVDANQLAALRTAGYDFLEVDDDVNGSNAVIDVATKTVIKFNAPPPPVPNLLVQLVAAQIASGALSADAFHPVTKAEMNAMLSAVNMAPIAIEASVESPGAAVKAG